MFLRVSRAHFFSLSGYHVGHFELILVQFREIFIFFVKNFGFSKFSLKVNELLVYPKSNDAYTQSLMINEWIYNILPTHIYSLHISPTTSPVWKLLEKEKEFCCCIILGNEFCLFCDFHACLVFCCNVIVLFAMWA